MYMVQPMLSNGVETKGKGVEQAASLDDERARTASEGRVNNERESDCMNSER